MKASTSAGLRGYWPSRPFARLSDGGDTQPRSTGTHMHQHDTVKTSPHFPIPSMMRAWVLGDPDQLTLTTKSTPVPKRAEVLVRIDAVAICATDLEIISH